MKTKQVIVIRRDLNMRTGKMIAQGAHASMSFLTKSAILDGKTAYIALSEVIKHWLMNSYKKVTVYVNTEEELMEIYNKARTIGLTAALVTDSGKTEFKGKPTKTCVAIGPDQEEKIDLVTGGLPLL